MAGEAVLDNDETSQHCQMGRARLARRKAYVRNQWLKASQDETTDSNLADMGRVASRTCSRLPERAVGRCRGGRGTLRPGDVAGPEATVKACGVAVAKVQGHNWTPIPSKGSWVNVGTVAVSPLLVSHPAAWGRLSAWSADQTGTGRRVRSTPSLGKPGTWGRNPA